MEQNLPSSQNFFYKLYQECFQDFVQKFVKKFLWYFFQDSLGKPCTDFLSYFFIDIFSKTFRIASKIPPDYFGKFLKEYVINSCSNFFRKSFRENLLGIFQRVCLRIGSEKFSFQQNIPFIILEIPLILSSDLVSEIP